MSLHAFVDESLREGRYLLTATLVPPSQVRRVRASVRRLLLPGERELHIKRDKPARRRQVLDQVVSTGARASVYIASCTEIRQEAAREICLNTLVAELILLRVQRLVLDSREGRDLHDNRVIRAALAEIPAEHRPTWYHVDSTAEPIIWVSDSLGWAYGAGGDWRRRAQAALTAVIECR